MLSTVSSFSMLFLRQAMKWFLFLYLKNDYSILHFHNLVKYCLVELHAMKC
jgi:hypothetical protein